MSSDDCVFCKMVAGQIPVTKIYEDQVILAFLDIAPVSDGHTLVIPKQHFEKLEQCPPDILAHIGKSLGKIAKVVSTAMQAQGYNILNNNGRAAGQVVDHLHFHIICRTESDGIFKHWPACKYPPGKINQVAEKIKEML